MRRAALALLPLVLLAAGSKPEGHRMEEAKGRFEVKLVPQATPDGGIAHYALSKTFHGGLEGSSTGEMLAVRTATEGSAGYVLIEHVTGTIGGRTGGFMLEHWGIMDRGTPEQRVVVIPDSGTGELAGIAGEMRIDAGAGHAYVLTYRLGG